jgi:hypothetical protein
MLKIIIAAQLKWQMGQIFKILTKVALSEFASSVRTL